MPQVAGAPTHRHSRRSCDMKRLAKEFRVHPGEAVDLKRRPNQGLCDRLRSKALLASHALAHRGLLGIEPRLWAVILSKSGKRKLRERCGPV